MILRLNEAELATQVGGRFALAENNAATSVTTILESGSRVAGSWLSMSSMAFNTRHVSPYYAQISLCAALKTVCLCARTPLMFEA